MNRRLAVLFVLLASCAPARQASTVDILIFGPHPDDAAIGCTGVMVHALRQGKRVGVVVITNGDGYVKATAQVARKTEAELTPEDFFRVAAVRQRQSRTALSRIGIRPEDHHFLAYPDGGMTAMRGMKGSAPYRQAHTRKAQTYGAAFEDYASQIRGMPAPYTWAAAVDVVEEILRTRRPSEIYVTDAGDRHPDHQSSFFLVRDAARRSGYRGRFFAFLVHGAKAQAGSTPEKRPLAPDLVAFKRDILKEYAKNLGNVHDDLHLKAVPTETFWPIRLD